MVVGINGFNPYIMAYSCHFHNHFVAFFICFQFVDSGFVVYSGLLKDKILGILVHIDHAVGKTLLELLSCDGSEGDADAGIERIGTCVNKLFGIRHVVVSQHQSILRQYGRAVFGEYLGLGEGNFEMGLFTGVVYKKLSTQLLEVLP